MDLPSLLVPEAIAIDYDAADSSDVIKTLGGILNRLGYVRDDFVAATLEREATDPTGVPLGGKVNAALPHVDVKFVVRPAVALATLKQPVKFQQMVETSETVDVQLVIMLALDRPKSQIEMLRQVSEILQSEDRVDALMNSRTRDEVLKIISAL